MTLATFNMIRLFPRMGYAEHWNLNHWLLGISSPYGFILVARFFYHWFQDGLGRSQLFSPCFLAITSQICWYKPDVLGILKYTNDSCR